jgi:hypothetical protein
MAVWRVANIWPTHGAGVPHVSFFGDMGFEKPQPSGLGDRPTVQVLLDKGTKADMTANGGISAMTIARSSGCKKAVKQLRSAGAK